MKKNLKSAAILFSMLSILLVGATIVFMMISALYPGAIDVEESDVFKLFIVGTLIASTAIPFVLSSLGQNLMMAAYNKEMEEMLISRLLIIVFFSPFMILIFIFPYILVSLFSLIYGELAANLANSLHEFIAVDASVLSPWVSFFILGEALFMAFRYNLFDWFMSGKKGNSLNLAESQYQVVYDAIKNEKEKRMADLVKSSIRITAINLILVLFWASYLISGVTQIPFAMGNLPTILLAFFIGMIPLVLLENLRVRKSIISKK